MPPYKEPVFLAQCQNLEALKMLFESYEPDAPLLMHVRAASDPKMLSHTATHPFDKHPLTFMHNGYICDFENLKPKLREFVGAQHEFCSDSFGILDVVHHFYMKASASGQANGVTRLQWSVQAALKMLVQLQPKSEMTLNIAVGNEAAVVVTRFAHPCPQEAPSLYTYQGDGGLCIASEPLQLEHILEEEWRDVPVSSMVTMVSTNIQPPMSLKFSPLLCMGPHSPIEDDEDVLYEIELNHGWQPFDASTARKMAEAQKEGEPRMDFRARGHEYTIDFEATSAIRGVSQEEEPDEEMDDDAKLDAVPDWRCDS